MFPKVKLSFKFMLTPTAPTGEELIFYNYKEPLRQVKSGFGYQGVILSNKEGTRVQCHVCGYLFSSVGLHARSVHNLKASEYKKKFGLSGRTRLISEEMRTMLKIRTLKWINSMTDEQRMNIAKKRKLKLAEWRKKKGYSPLGTKMALEKRNERGTCPDQLLQKIKDCATALNRNPSKDEFITYCGSQKYIAIIYKTFGSWIRAKGMAGYEENKKGVKLGVTNRKTRYTKEELIELLQIFYQENKWAPTETDCRRGLIPDSSIYRREFGTFTNARLEAGIKEPVGRWITKR